MTERIEMWSDVRDYRSPEALRKHDGLMPDDLMTARKYRRNLQRITWKWWNNRRIVLKNGWL